MRRSRLVTSVLALALLAGAVAVGPGAGQSADGSGDDGASASARRLEVAVRNRGPADLGGDFDLRVDLIREETTVLSEHPDLAAGRRWTRTFDDAPAGDHLLLVNVSTTREGRLGSTEDSAEMGFPFETGNCPGRYRAALEVGVRRDEDGMSVTISTLTDETGCYAAPPGFDAVLADAHRIIQDPPEGDAIDVPTPRVGDVGRIEHRDGSPASQVDVARSAAFEVRPIDGFPGPWGEPVDGVEVVAEHRREDGRPTTHPRQTWKSVARFRTDSMAPFLTSSGSSSSAGLGVGPLHRSEERTDSRHLVYPDDGTSRACRWRFALQGTTIRAGETVPANRLCHGVRRTNLTFTAGRVVERDGMRLIPLVVVADRDDRTMVGRVWLADDVPYIVGSERYVAGPGPLNWAATTRLARYDAGDTPLPAGEIVRTEPPVGRHADLDPLAGPAADGLDIAYPLAEASRDARQDPSLAELQQLLLEDDAVLAGATYRIRQDVDDGPGGISGERLTWYMVFTAPGQDPVRVECERPRSTAQGSPLAAPRGRCQTLDHGPEYAEGLFDPVVIGRGDLPDRGASLGEVARRWRMAGADDAAPVTYVLYRGWTETGPDGIVGVEPTPPVVAVGSALSLGNEILPSEQERDFLQLEAELESARSRRIRVGSAWRASSLLGEADQAPEMDGGFLGGRIRPADRELPAAWGATAAAGAAALGIVGLIWYFLGGGKATVAALYTRMTGEDVLDHATRQAMVDRVEADPGIHASALGDALDLAHGQTRHHLRILVREGHLVEVTSGGYRRYFPAGRYDHDRMRAMAALRNGQNDKAFRVIRDNPGIGVTDLADRADVSMSYASKMVGELSEVGLVDKVRDGRRVALYADAG